MDFINENCRNFTFSYSDGREETFYNCKSFTNAVKKAEEIGLPFDTEFKVSSEKSSLFIKATEGKSKSEILKECAVKHGYEIIDIRLSK